MQLDRSTSRRVWIALAISAVLVVLIGGGVWLLNGVAPLAMYILGQGSLTIRINAPYQAIELPPAKYITDHVPLIEIPSAGESADLNSEQGRALAKYNDAVRALNAYSVSQQEKYEYANSHPGEPVLDDLPPPPLPPFPSP
jgi:hypothetical protein